MNVENKKISELESATTLNDYDIIPIVQDGTNKTVTKEVLFDSIMNDAEMDKKFKELDNKKADKATSLSGYGITNAYNKTEIDNLIKDFITNAVDNLVNYYKKNETYTRTEINTITEGFIDSNVNNLANYYKKDETYNKIEVNDLISLIPKFSIQVVGELPTTEISGTTIYLVPSTKPDEGDSYEEYIYINEDWEHIGSTKVDLSDYYTKSEVDDLLSNIQLSDYYTKTETDDLLAEKASKDIIVVNEEDATNDTLFVIGEGGFNISGTEVSSDLDSNSSSMAPSIKVLMDILGFNNIKWISTVTYTKNKVVYYNSKLYRNKTGTSTTTSPDKDTTNWEVTSLIVSS